MVTASRRARELDLGLEEGFADASAAPSPARRFRSRTRSDGRRETILYARDSGDMAAYEELRAGFTAAVSHELRTPLARVLALLETATLPGADVMALVEQAQGEVDQDPRADRRRPLPLPSWSPATRWSGLARLPFSPIAHRGRREPRGAGRARGRCGSRSRPTRTPNCPACDRGDPRGRSESRSELGSLRGPRREPRADGARRTEGGVELVAGDDGVGVAEDDLPHGCSSASTARTSRGPRAERGWASRS